MRCIDRGYAYNPAMEKQSQQKRLGMGIVGAGFVGPHHVDAVRRLGFVDIVAVAASSEESAHRKAGQIGARKSYANYEALISDPDVQVVHVATPNNLHYPVISAALAKGKHVVSDKPLEPAIYKKRLRDLKGLSHVTIEVEHCPH